MKRTSRLLYLQIAAVVALLSFGVCAYAQQQPRKELAHAYWLLKTADHDYHGHRLQAMHAIEKAGKALGLDLQGDLPELERQWKSDAQVAQAGKLLHDVRDKMEDADRKLVADHVETAVREVDAALRDK